VKALKNVLRARPESAHLAIERAIHRVSAWRNRVEEDRTALTKGYHADLGFGPKGARSHSALAHNERAVTAPRRTNAEKSCKSFLTAVVGN
jgi:hypothetical protein